MENTKPLNLAKEALKEYRWILKERDELLREMDESFGRATSCTVRMKPHKTSGGASYDRMADDVVRLVDSRDRLKAKVAELDEALRTIMNMIDQVKDRRQRTVLTMLYVRGMNWKEIEQETNYCERQLKRYHGYALSFLNKRFFPNK